VRPDAEHVDLYRRGEAFMLAQVAALDDGALGEPCALPGWTRSHLLAHLARNADALGNLLRWASTGVETPMYTSAEQRESDIMASARQAPAALRADVAAASTRLAEALAALPDPAWSATVRTARGRPITPDEVPWMRIRETWVHAVDLDVGATFADLPAAVVTQLVDEVATGLAGRADCPAMAVVPDDLGGRRWRVGPAGGEAVEVTGPGAAVLAWIIGRSAGEGLKATAADGRPPAPPPWL